MSEKREHPTFKDPPPPPEECKATQTPEPRTPAYSTPSDTKPDSLKPELIPILMPFEERLVAINEKMTEAILASHKELSDKLDILIAEKYS